MRLKLIKISKRRPSVNDEPLKVKLSYLRGMKTALLSLIFLFASLSVLSQSKVIVFLKDKGDSPNMQLSERAINRRLKNNAVLDENDRVLYAPYLEELSNDGIILNQSKWLNAVTFETDVAPNDLLAKYAFIERISASKKEKPIPRKDVFDYVDPKALNYGNADTQVRQIGADCMHDLGYTGQGVYMAIIDAGFKGMDTIPYFDSVYNQNRVLDTFDFTNNASIYNYSGHGTAVSSCVFGHKGGLDPYAGTAVDVDVALYVAEDVASETLIEEFNVVAALERCDSVGVDIANISLGYFGFDDPSENHAYADLDGNTTIAAMGVNVAASKGIVVVMSAGNAGPSNISTPCDADNGLCVGATDNQGNYAFFSSVGPASDGAIKPDVAATGWNTWVILEDGSLVMGNGTSFSSPVMAGGVACLIGAHPTKSVAQIIASVQESGHQFDTPDEFLGYGIPDLCEANDSLNISGVGIHEIGDAIYTLFPNPTSGIVTIYGLENHKAYEIEILNNVGQIVFKELVTAGEQPTINVHFLANGIYTVRLNEGTFMKRLVVQH
mgnify:CR=1 FL=1